MRERRFTIAFMLGVFFIAVAIAALRASNDAWDRWIFGTTLLILLTAILLAVHHSEWKRPYWLGFALFGWAYVGASLVPTIEARLPTTKGLAYLGSLMPPLTIDLTTKRSNPSQDPTFRTEFLNPDGSLKPNVVLGIEGMTGKAFATRGGPPPHFLPIGHSLLALLMAFLGGHFSRFLRSRVRRDDPVLRS